MALFKKISTTAEEVKTGSEDNKTSLYRCSICGEEQVVVEYDRVVEGFICDECKQKCGNK